MRVSKYLASEIVGFAMGVAIGGSLAGIVIKKIEKAKKEKAKKVDETEESVESCGELPDEDNCPSQNASVTRCEARRDVLGIGDDKESTELEKARKLAQNDFNKPDILTYKRTGERINYSGIIASNSYKVNKAEEEIERDIRAGVQEVDYSDCDFEPDENIIPERDPNMTYPVDDDSCDEDYDVVDLTYYECNDALVEDVTDHIVSMHEILTGMDVRDYFDDRNEDPDMAYFRNDARKTIYAISRNCEKFEDIMSERGLKTWDDELEDIEE